MHEDLTQLTKTSSEELGGLRMTKQRRVVYDVVRDHSLDHPTAAQVFTSAKDRMPSISLATVYNCLDTLIHAGLITQVNLDREASRYCPNLEPHAHFFCSSCGAVHDVKRRPLACLLAAWMIPDGCQVEEVSTSFRGLCKHCANSSR